MARNLEAYLLRVIAAEQPASGVVPNCLRGLFGRLARLYDAGLEVYLLAEKLGLRRREKLPIPILSVGNLSVGGTGKTPMTQMLCRRLSSQGTRVALLSRGHGGDSQSVRVVSDGDGHILLSASEAGDEPVQTARALPNVPVLVGKDRRLSGREALRRFGLEALVLDDGFQYWQLARDLDIVLLDSRFPFDNGYPLPRGLLREPKRHLRRAAMAVVTRADRLDAMERVELEKRICELAPKIELFFASHVATELIDVGHPEVNSIPLDHLRAVPIVALSAIAQPQSFLETLTKATASDVRRHLVWNDHHSFSTHDVQSVISQAKSLSARAIVMTEKDAAKWPLDVPSDSLDIYALRIEMQVENESEFLASINRRLFGK